MPDVSGMYNRKQNAQLLKKLATMLTRKKSKKKKKKKKKKKIWSLVIFVLS